MKKLITLLLVLTGCVCTVSATDVTVYFRPDPSTWGVENATFKLVTAENGEGNSTAGVVMTETSTAGVFSAVLDNSSVTQFKFARMSADGNTEWNKHDSWTTLEAYKYYEMNGVYENWSKLNITKRDLTQSWYIWGQYHITVGFHDFPSNAAAQTANTMTPNAAKTELTLTVENRPIKAGNYEFKFVGDDWVGDGSENGSGSPGYYYLVKIASDGVYDIKYTFNQLSRTGAGFRRYNI